MNELNRRKDRLFSPLFVEKLASLHLPIKRGSDSIKGMIRELRKGFLLAALATAVVSGCGGRDKGNATPTAAAQYEEIVAAIDEVKHEEWMQEEGFAQEIAALIGYFDRTADATYATGGPCCIWHACSKKQNWRDAC